MIMGRAQRNPFPVITLGFCLGLMAQDRFFLPFFVWCVFAGLLLLSSLIFFNHPRVCSWFVLFIYALMGGLYFSSYQKFPANDVYYMWRDRQDEVFEIQGRIVSQIRRRETPRGTRTSFEMALENVRTQTFSAGTRGKILAHCFIPRDFQPGDQIRFRGKLQRPYSFSPNPKFSYRRYLGRKGIYFETRIGKKSNVEILSRWERGNFSARLGALNRRCREILKSYLMPEQSALMDAVLLGGRTEISAQTQQSFIRTGTAHILAISGLNVGVVAAMVILLLRLFPVPRAWQYALSMLFLGVYAVFTGAGPSVVRAAIMACVFLSSFLFERESDGLNSVSWAAFIILLINPNNLFDIGFQLSFLSVIGILFFFPLLTQAVLGRKAFKIKGAGDFILKSLLVSLSAWLGAAGLVAYYFDIVTPGSLLANLIAVPIMSGLVILGAGLMASAGGGAVGMDFMAADFAVCIKFLLNLVILSMTFMSQLPGVYFPVHVQTAGPVLGYYLIVGWFYFFMKERAGERGDNFKSEI